MSFPKLGKFSRIALALGCSAVLFSVPAFANTGGNTGWIVAATNVGKLGDAAIIAITALCAAGGIGAIGYAGKLLLKKSGDRGDDVEWSKIGYAVLGGAFLISIAFIASTTVETLGGQKSNTYNKVI